MVFFIMAGYTLHRGTHCLCDMTMVTDICHEDGIGFEGWRSKVCAHRVELREGMNVGQKFIID